MVGGLVPKGIQLEQGLRSEDVCFAVKLFAHFRGNRLFAFFDDPVYVALPRHECVSRFVQLQERLLDDQHGPIDIYEPGSGVENSQNFP